MARIIMTRAVAGPAGEEPFPGQAIADFMLAVMKDPARKVDQRMEAATWLADRGFGKPAQVIAHGGDGENLAPIILTWGESE
jgi:hypothetical protein